MRRYKKKNKLIPVLVILLLGITLGYAYLNTELNINGTTNVSSANWNIYWDNIQFGSNNVTDITTPATISQGLTEVTFNVNFSEPGDTYEFTVDAVNDGSIDAMTDVVSNGVYAANGTTPKNLPAYLEYTVTYSDGVPIDENHLLEAGDTETYKVRVHYKKDISSSQLPSTADNYVFKFSVTYVQADSNATPHDSGIYTVNTYNIGGIISIGQPMPNTITIYQKPALAMIAFSNRPVYLKHTISNNIVTDSYVGFVVTAAMAQANPGMTVGTYYLRGRVDEYSLSEKPLYESNKEIMKQAFGYEYNSDRCTEYRDAFRCTVSGLSATVWSYGYVSASDGNGAGCDVFYEYDDYSYCFD